MKDSAARQTKSIIIVILMEYLEDNERAKVKLAIEELSKYAKFYKIPLRKKAVAPNVKKHLKEFILNNEGYITTIANLYNSLCNL